MLQKIIIVFCCFCWMNRVAAQEGTFIRFTTTHGMFPDSLRKNGYDYNGRHFDAAAHYSDSSVLLYVPAGFKASGRVNLVFWFHGWGNNIDTANRQFQLTAQFEASGRNAVFVFPEGPKNASDSYGGKLEQPQVFAALLKDVEEQLKQHKRVAPNKDLSFDITLAGHSGAYRVISRILNKTPVSEVILFDAMYGGNDAYLAWLAVPEHRFINIYTKDGGTYNNSLAIAKAVSDSLHVPVVSVNEEAVTDQLLNSHNKVFIFSSKGHNEVILNNRNWERFLRSHYIRISGS